MGELSLSVLVGGSQRSRRMVLTSGTMVEPENTVPASPRALIAAGVAEPDTEQSRDTIHDVQSPSCAVREVSVCSSAGSESCWGEMEDIGDDEVADWGALPLPTHRTESRELGPTVPDSVVDALLYDLTHGDSDTDSLATIDAGDVEHDDPAEEHEVRSVGGLEDVASEAEEEEVTFQ